MIDGGDGWEKRGVERCKLFIIICNLWCTTSNAQKWLCTMTILRRMIWYDMKWYDMIWAGVVVNKCTTMEILYNYCTRLLIPYKRTITRISPRNIPKTLSSSKWRQHCAAINPTSVLPWRLYDPRACDARQLGRSMARMIMSRYDSRGGTTRPETWQL